MTVSLRPATDADEEFLFALFVQSREYDAGIFPEAQREALMRMQFRGQRITYTRNHAQSEHSIIEREGRDAGRVWVAEDAGAIAILDIALLPQYRNLGIGTQIYRELAARAEAAGKPIHATVSTSNPGSLRFHERWGFQRMESDGFQIVMKRPSA